MSTNFAQKKVVVFDLDGTLAESKTLMDSEMADLLAKLLAVRQVAVIGGGWFPQFEKQLIAGLTAPSELRAKLFLFPTSGATFYRFVDGGWKREYADELTPEERAQIKDAFERAFSEIGYTHPETLYGDVIEDRGTQITFSALGQQAPLELKYQWRDTQDRRREIVAVMEKYLPEFEIKMPGVTSIDVTHKGIDKAYGIEQIKKFLNVAVPEIVFLGDALFPGGNDEPVKRTGVETIAVSGPHETKQILCEWLF